MTKNNKNLYVFAYGLSLLLSLLYISPALKENFNNSVLFTAIFLCAFTVVMILAIICSYLKPICNYWILTPLTFSMWYRFDSNAGGVISLFLFLVVVLILLAAIHKLDSIKPIYDIWMTGVDYISRFLTCIILMFIYYFILTPLAVVSRLKGDVFLDLSWRKKIDSYWIVKESHQSFNPLDYEKQF